MEQARKAVSQGLESFGIYQIQAPWPVKVVIMPTPLKAGGVAKRKQDCHTHCPAVFGRIPASPKGERSLETAHVAKAPGSCQLILKKDPGSYQWIPKKNLQNIHAECRRFGRACRSFGSFS
jgi:hypothetical protein